MSTKARWRAVSRMTAFRLTLILGSVFTLGLAAQLSFVAYTTSRLLTARSDHILDDEARQLLAVAPEALPQAIDRLAAGTDLGRAGLISAAGMRVAGNISLSGPPPAFGRAFDAAGAAGGHPLRMLALRTATAETILVGRDVSQIRLLRRAILRTLLVSGGILLAAVLAIAVALSWPMLQRVRVLERTGAAIAGGDLARRMPVSGRGDELDVFARVVNAMVDDVSRTLVQVKGVTDAIAHDLRTPLTRVRARLGRAEAAGGDETRALASAACEDLDAVLARFAALLRVSEIEATRRRAGFAAVDLGALIDRAAELYEPLAEERGLALTAVATASATVDADAALLFEALANLLDNAVKFARTTVRLGLDVTAAGAVLWVGDDGPGIAATDREAAVQPFRRGGHAAAGSGLGLSIVAAIVRLHGGTLVLADAAPGLVARIVLPTGDDLT